MFGTEQIQVVKDSTNSVIFAVFLAQLYPKLKNYSKEHEIPLKDILLIFDNACNHTFLTLI